MADLNTPEPLSKRLKANFLLGLLTFAPIGVTLWILWSVVKVLDGWVYNLLPEDLARLPGLGILVTVFLLLVVGSLARTYLGRVMNSLMDSLIGRIPMIRAVYSTLKQMAEVFFSGNASDTFKRVVYVPFPHAESRTLAFVSGKGGKGEVLVFIPTAPNPTNGFIVAYPEAHVVDTNISLDEALQVIISGGALGRFSKEK